MFYMFTSVVAYGLGRGWEIVWSIWAWKISSCSRKKWTRLPRLFVSVRWNYMPQLPIYI